VPHLLIEAMRASQDARSEQKNQGLGQMEGLQRTAETLLEAANRP